MRDSRWPRGTWTAPGQVRLLELVLLAHVDDHGRRCRSRWSAIVDLLGVHLLDLLLDPADHVRAGSHYFIKTARGDAREGDPEKRGALSGAPAKTQT